VFFLKNIMLVRVEMSVFLKNKESFSKKSTLIPTLTNRDVGVRSAVWCSEVQCGTAAWYTVLQCVEERCTQSTRRRGYALEFVLYTRRDVGSKF